MFSVSRIVPCMQANICTRMCVDIRIYHHQLQNLDIDKVNLSPVILKKE